VKKVNVRNLLRHPEVAIRDGLKTNLIIVFEDGVEQFMSSGEIILLRYLIRLNNITPHLPITSNYDITKYYNSGIYIASSINKCFEKILEEVVINIVRPANDRSILEPMYEEMVVIFNLIYNEVIYSKLDYVTSLNIKDFLDIQMHKELLDAMKQVNVEKSLESVKKTYDVLDDIIRNKVDHSKNIIARSYISGTVNPDQVKQMLAARGFLTEIDSSIFKYPVASSYTLGLDNIYELAVESRAGAKALVVSNKAIQETEYFARELQLVVMSIEKLLDGDCGNKDHINYFVRDASRTGKSDLPNLLGKRFLNEITGLEEIITPEHKHLENTTIKLRSVLHCKHTSKNSVCTHCFGELYHGVFAHTNLGHISSTTPTQKMSQGILSTKHLTSSATSSSIVLDETAKRFFSVKGKDGYALRANVLGKSRSKMFITINQKEAFGLKDLANEANVYKLNPARVSIISSFILSIVQDSGKSESFPIIVKTGSRYGNFTYEFLKYVQENGFVLDDSDRYVIDLSDYTSTAPILTLPQVEFNFLALSKEVKSEFKYLKFVKGKYSIETPESLLFKVFDLLNSKLNINIALLEVMVYAFTIMGYTKKDYDIGRNSDDPQLARIYDIIANRSLGGGYAWETVNSILLSPKSYDGNNNIDHLLDVMIRPEQTMHDYYGYKSPQQIH